MSIRKPHLSFPDGQWSNWLIIDVVHVCWEYMSSEYLMPMPSHVDGKDHQLHGIVIGIDNTDSLPYKTIVNAIRIINDKW